MKATVKVEIEFSHAVGLGPNILASEIVGEVARLLREGRGDQGDSVAIRTVVVEYKGFVEKVLLL